MKSPTIKSPKTNSKIVALALLAATATGIAAYPLTLLSAGIVAMQEALACLSRGETPKQLLAFEELRELVGFDAYDREQGRYAPKEDS